MVCPYGTVRGRLHEHTVPIYNQHGMQHEGPEGLAEHIQHLLDSTAVTAGNVGMIQACVRELQMLLFKLGPNWRLATFGSAVNGFGTCNSDLDLTCFQEGAVQSGTSPTNKELQLRLAQLLWHHPRFDVIEQIWGARIPILKLQFDGILDVDLSVNNTEPLLNTKLLRSYSKLDPIVRDLVVVIKLWAKHEGVCGAAVKYLSSYSLTLMVIYFLQVHPSTYMPCLPTSSFAGDLSSRGSVSGKWSCAQSISTLVYNFFTFFAAEFKWGDEVVSVRVGKRIPASAGIYGQLRGRIRCPRLHIEDPFLVHRNLNCVLGHEQEYIFRGKIFEAAQKLYSGSIPNGLGLDVACLLSKLNTQFQANKMNNGSSDVESNNSTHIVSTGSYESESFSSAESTKRSDSIDNFTCREIFPAPQPECRADPTVAVDGAPRSEGPCPDEIPIPIILLGFKALVRL